MPVTSQAFGLTIIGGGPAGLAPLLAAHRVGRLDELLATGIAIVEQSSALGAGDIGNYGINSDSTGDTFFDCLRSVHSTPLTALQSDPLAMEVAAAGDGPVPLTLVGRFMSLVGETLAGMIGRHPMCEVFLGHRAVSVQQQLGGWKVILVDHAGTRKTISSESVVSATGAHQPQGRLESEFVGDMHLASRVGAKLWQSGQVFGLGGFDRVADALRQLPSPKVAIVGGSTSAAAVAHALLHRLPSVQFGAGAITLLHRRELRIYYPSEAAAQAEGYTEYGENDICPISKRVFRFAGFRLDSREMIMQVRGIGGRAPEKRLKLHRLQPNDAVAAEILDAADLVVAAIGYRPRGVPVFDVAGEPVELLSDTSPNAPLVDHQCRIVNSSGAPLPGLFGIGLAAGFMPSGALGGEPSFSGQANGLWLWQNDVGMLIVDAVLAPMWRGHGLTSESWEALAPDRAANRTQVAA